MERALEGHLNACKMSGHVAEGVDPLPRLKAPYLRSTPYPNTIGV